MNRLSGPTMAREPGGIQRIDLRKLPPLEQARLGKTLLAAVKRFYENPNNVKAFEAWKKERDGEAYG